MRVPRLQNLRGSYRYGLVLGLTVIDGIVQLVLPDTQAALLVVAALMIATVITALFASNASHVEWRRTRRVVLISMVVLVAAAISGAGQAERSVIYTMSGLLAILGAGIVGRGVVGGIRVEERVTLHTVMGALTIYLLAGMIFAFAYSAEHAIAGHAVLSHLGRDLHAEETYFSFITLTTVGYGDISPVTSASRMTAVMEALFGQLYLVTIVAVVVSNLAPRRARPAGPDDAPGTPD